MLYHIVNDIYDETIVWCIVCNVSIHLLYFIFAYWFIRYNNKLRLPVSDTVLDAGIVYSEIWRRPRSECMCACLSLWDLHASLVRMSLKCVKSFLPSTLVMASARCSVVETGTILIILFSTCSLKKWWRMSMCAFGSPHGCGIVNNLDGSTIVFIYNTRFFDRDVHVLQQHVY